MYRLLPPDEIVRMAAERKDLKDTPFIVSLRKTDFSAGEFSASFQKACEPLSLNENERAVLLSWSETFGKSDRASQLFSCDETLCRLKSFYDEAKEEANKKGRLYLSLGVLGGVFVAVLLI